jgi:putative transposase
VPRLPGHQAGTELGEDAEAEAGVGQLEAEGVLPIDPGAHGIGRLPVAEVFQELEDRDQRQPPGRESGLAPAGVEAAEVLVAVERAELVAGPRRDRAAREGSAGDTRGLGWDLADRLRMKAHDYPHRRNRCSRLRRQYLTYVPTWAGFLYLAVVLDAFSRRVVGWAMATHLRAQLVLDALDMALWRRRPDDVIHHSDQGSQYTSLAFGARCREAGVRPSMGSVGDAYDNALCEAFFATLECELLDRRRFRSQAEARMAVFSFIEGWYNPRRRHSALGYLSPVEYEKRVQAGA